MRVAEVASCDNANSTCYDVYLASDVAKAYMLSDYLLVMVLVLLAILCFKLTRARLQDPHF